MLQKKKKKKKNKTKKYCFILYLKEILFLKVKDVHFALLI